MTQNLNTPQLIWKLAENKVYILSFAEWFSIPLTVEGFEMRERERRREQRGRSSEIETKLRNRHIPREWNCFWNAHVGVWSLVEAYNNVIELCRGYKGVRNQRGRGGRTEIHHCGCCCVCYLRHCPHRRYDGVGRFVQIPTDTDVYLHMTGALI